MRPHRDVLAIATLALLAILGACSRAPGSGGKGALSGDIHHPSQVIYEFVKESGGTSPSKGAKILLGFDPSGEAYLYALKPGEHVAYHGHWTYADGHMTLSFASSSLTVDARFALNLTAVNVTLPFQIFAGKPGTSDWKAAPLPLVGGIFATYFAALTDKDNGHPHEEAVRHALAYAQARIGLEPPRGAATPPVDGPRWVAGLLPAAMASTPPAGCSADEIPSRVIAHGNSDLILHYRCGVEVTLLLRPIVDEPSQPPLTLAVQASDPRIFINTHSPGNGQYDPLSKTTLIFAPFVNMDSAGVTNPFDHLTQLSDYLGGSADPAPDPKQFSIVPALQAHGFDTTNTLINSAATVKNLVKALAQNPSPGFVILDSHGGDDGTIATGDFWLSDTLAGGAHPTVGEGFSQYLQHLRAAGLGDLIDYERPANTADDKWFTTTLGIMTLSIGGDPEEFADFASLTPKFWEWAEKAQHADFHRSLVYVSACDTDATPLLRSTIQAGSYFAWRREVASDLAAAVARYIAASLSRPTHSAEETYYHLQRIGNLHNMFYVEDALLNGVAGGVGNTNPGALQAYGWDGSQLIEYRLAGWYGTALQWKQAGASDSANKFEATQVWHLLFAARWSEDPRDGATKLVKCLNEVWKPRNAAGGLFSPQCTAYDNGTVPSDDEVGYAVYLLSGTVNPSFSGLRVPRWTLDDGAAPRN